MTPLVGLTYNSNVGELKQMIERKTADNTKPLCQYRPIGKNYTSRLVGFCYFVSNYDYVFYELKRLLQIAPLQHIA